MSSVAVLTQESFAEHRSGLAQQQVKGERTELSSCEVPLNADSTGKLPCCYPDSFPYVSFPASCTAQEWSRQASDLCSIVAGSAVSRGMGARARVEHLVTRQSGGSNVLGCCCIPLLSQVLGEGSIALLTDLVMSFSTHPPAVS